VLCVVNVSCECYGSCVGGRIGSGKVTREEERKGVVRFDGSTSMHHS